jgi:hypothetical protein
MVTRNGDLIVGERRYGNLDMQFPKRASGVSLLQATLHELVCIYLQSTTLQQLWLFNLT